MLALLLLPAPLRPLALVGAERIVHQLLLLAHQPAKLFQLFHHLAGIAVLHLLAALRHLQIVEQRLQLGEQLPGGVAVAELCQILDAVQHSFQIALAQHLAVHVRHHLRQLVALARALVMRPRILLADEPTGNLDTRNSDQVHELLLELNQEYSMTMVVVTHNMQLAAFMSRCVTIADGQFVEKC